MFVLTWIWHFSRWTKNNFWWRLRNFWPQNWHSKCRFKDELKLPWPKSEKSLPCMELMRKSLWVSRTCLTKVSSFKNWAAQHKHPQDWHNKSWPWRIFRKSSWCTDNKWHSRPKLYPNVWMHRGQFNLFKAWLFESVESSSRDVSDSSVVLQVSRELGDGKRLKEVTQCENLAIYLPLWFYVISILAAWKSKPAILNILKILIFWNLWIRCRKFSKIQTSKLLNSQNGNFHPSDFSQN